MKVTSIKTVYSERGSVISKIAFVLGGLATLITGVVKAEVSWTGEGAIEQRYFLQQALETRQPRSQLSGYFKPEIYADWNDGNDSLLFRPFYRLDAEDGERSHGDIRELLWWHGGDSWELKAGIGKVFWGQTESIHLVDVINQTDWIEAIDGEDKLGQPMVSLAWISDYGTFTAFALPYFRERTFPGLDGRLRASYKIDTDNALYESGDEDKHKDWALRWQHTLGDLDLGLSYFTGTAREPIFVPQISETDIRLLPYYRQMDQIGLDALMVAGAWLLKLEAIHRKIGDESFYASVAGFEYTSVGIFNSQYDIGWLMEYQYDDRDELALTVSQNDVMFGMRIGFNDFSGTEVLIGYVQDLDYSQTHSAFLEASSRINDRWKWRLESWLFSGDEPQEPTYYFRRDDYLQASLEYYF